MRVPIRPFTDDERRRIVGTDARCCADVLATRQRTDIAEVEKEREVMDRMHRCLRFHMYRRQVTALQHAGILEASNARVRLPQCVEAAIRKQYPALDHEYTGFVA